MKPIDLPELEIPSSLTREEMPDLLRHWYLGTRARRHMMLRRFREVDGEIGAGVGSRVLDIGSAWGYNVMALERMGFRAVGMDLVVDQFGVGQAVAAANDVPLNVVGADAAGLPFPDHSFDAVTMVETFEHIYAEDRLVTLRECRRVLGPGGRLILSTPKSALTSVNVPSPLLRKSWCALNRNDPSSPRPSLVASWPSTCGIVRR